MVDLILYSTALISAIISYFTGLVFLRSFLKERKINRAIWCIAFILYAIGHTIVAIITAMELPPTDPSYLFLMWLYVNLAGAGTTGLILYSTFPFITEKKYLKEAVTSIFAFLYVVGSALYAFVFPGENPLAFVNPGTHSQLGNMSWWVVECLIPVSFFVGIMFLKYYKSSKNTWAIFTGLSLVIYAIILFIWPIPDLKPTFYIIRCISVGFLCIGGILLSRE